MHRRNSSGADILSNISFTPPLLVSITDPRLKNPASNAEIVSHAAGATPTSFVTFSEIIGEFIVKLGFGSRFR
jgi:hypothetical protein